MSNSQQLRIAYIFMQYPYPSQTFAISDIQTLEAMGHTVIPLSLRTPHPKHDKLCEMYNIPNQRKNSATATSALAIFNPLNWRYAAFGLRQLLPVLTDTKPLKERMRDLAKAAALIPTSCQRIRQLKNMAKNGEGVDVIHIFWSHYPSIFALMAKKFMPNTHLSLFCGAYDLERHVALTPHAAKVADSVWTHAYDNLGQLAARGIDITHVNVVHRGIPIATFPKLSHIKKHPHRICVASAFQPEKNIDACLAAMPEIVKHIPKADMVVVGDGAAKEALHAQAKASPVAHKISFTGYIPRQQVLETMAESSLFLFLSTKKSDRLPNVVKEAMLAGCTCVVSCTAGIEELLPPQQKVGKIVEDLSPENVAKAIAEGLKNKGMGQRSTTWVKENFDARICMQRYHDIWCQSL